MRFSVAVAALCFSIVGVSAGQHSHASMTVRKPTNISAQPLESALQILAKERDLQVIYASDLVARKQSAGAVGTFTPDEALGKLLAGTGLTYRYLNDATVTIILVSSTSGAAAPPAVTPATSRVAPETSGDLLRDAFLVAQASVTQAAATTPVEPPPAADKGGAYLEEVLVTAQKRAEPLQNVPASVQVISADVLDRLGAVQLSDYAKQVPGLNIIGAGGPGQGEPIIRGITTGADRGYPVGIYLDGFPTMPSSPIGFNSPNVAFDPDLADVQRIEVLAGPQSTLYGANTIGGAINIVTAQPSLADGLSGTLRGYGSTISDAGSGYGIRGTANIPIVPDAMALRATAFYREDPGFITNVYNNQTNVNNAYVGGGRVSLLIKFNDRLENTLSGLLQHIDQPGPNIVFLDPATLKPAFGGLSFSSAVPQPTTNEYRFLGNTTTWTLDSLTITNLLGYTRIVSDSTADAGLYGTFVPGFPPDYHVSAQVINDTERYTDELRLTSAPGRLEWFLGGFYTWEKDLDPVPIIGLSPSGIPLPATDPFYNIYNFYQDARYKELAAYGDLTLHFTSQLQGTLGLRYSRDDQSVYYSSTGLLGIQSVQSPTISNSGASYLATIVYKAAPSLTLYARAASGYRPGGPNVINAVEISSGAPKQFGPDTLWNYEVGAKGFLWDQRLSYSASVYHMLWRDLQVNDQINGYQVLTNASSAKSDGAELSLELMPTKDLSLVLKGSYNKAQFTSEVPLLAGGAVDGDPLPFAPKFMGAFLADYTYAHLADHASASVGLTYTGRGAQDSAYTNGVSYRMASVNTLDLRAGFDWSRLSLKARVDNVTNEYGLTNVATGFDAAQTLYGVAIRPRTYSLVLEVRL